MITIRAGDAGAENRDEGASYEFTDGNISLPAVTLPNVERVVIDPRKLRDYLLSPDHPVGSAKARWFSRLGFNRDGWRELEKALRELIAQNPAEATVTDKFGQRFRVTGSVQTPSGRRVRLTSVWMIRAGEEVPFFVTAFPSEAA